MEQLSPFDHRSGIEAGLTKKNSGFSHSVTAMAGSARSDCTGRRRSFPRVSWSGKHGRTTKKLFGYWHEAIFGWTARRTWADQFALLRSRPVSYSDGLGCACDTRSAIAIDLWIDRDRPATLRYDLFAGDLFVSDEVLAFLKCYHIDPALRPTNTDV